MNINSKYKSGMNKGMTLFLLLYTFFSYSQESNSGVVQSSNSAERFPVFSNCINLQSKELESCFYNQVQDFVFENFEVPENLKQNNFQGEIKVLFEVDINGVFKVIYADAAEENLIKESKRVFAKFPKIKPSTYNGRPTYSKFTITISIPLKSRGEVEAEALAQAEFLPNKTKKLTELDSIVYKKYDSKQV